MQSLGILFIYIFAFAWAFFFLLIFPIWTIIHCVSSSSRGTASKIFWIILIILTWTLGSILYGLLSSQKKAFQVISIFYILIVLVLGGSSIWGSKAVVQHAKGQITSAIQEIDQIDTTEMTPQQVADFKESLILLQEDLKGDYRQLKRQYIVLIFLDYFKIITMDSKITSAEDQDWMNKFQARSMLDRRKFKNSIREMKKRH